MGSSLRAIRRDMMKAARAGRTLTYGEIMRAHHLSRGHRLTRAIGEIDRAENKNGAPGFAAIIVRKDTGFPGGGYFCDDELPPQLRRSRDRSTDPRLSQPEMEHVLKQQRKVWDYYGPTMGRLPAHSTT